MAREYAHTKDGKIIRVQSITRGETRTSGFVFREPEELQRFIEAAIDAFGNMQSGKWKNVTLTAIKNKGDETTGQLTVTGEVTTNGNGNGITKQ